VKCTACESESVHDLELMDGVTVPLCRQHLLRAFRRMKRGDKEAVMFRYREIVAGWRLTRVHKGRAKVNEETLLKIARLKTSGLSISGIAYEIGVTKSLVHRYVMKLEDVHE
jgi:hypothetical protein